ncbi:28730_t:CDS:1, partial [Dentiscutata erythropus]
MKPKTYIPTENDDKAWNLLPKLLKTTKPRTYIPTKNDGEAWNLLPKLQILEPERKW